MLGYIMRQGECAVFTIILGVSISDNTVKNIIQKYSNKGNVENLEKGQERHWLCAT